MGRLIKGAAGRSECLFNSVIGDENLDMIVLETKLQVMDGDPLVLVGQFKKKLVDGDSSCRHWTKL
jgi:hypothetical protein